MTELARKGNGPCLSHYAYRVYGLGEKIVAGASRSLLNTDQPMPGYIWRAWLIAFIPGVIISSLQNLVVGLPDTGGPAPNGPSIAWVVVTVLISPWAETLLMWPILRVLRALIAEPLSVAFVSAIIWGNIHWKLAAASGFTAAWWFFIFSMCFLEWEKKSTGRAVLVTAFVHMCLNSAPVILVVALVVVWS